jgi:hypothetical protein
MIPKLTFVSICALFSLGLARKAEAIPLESWDTQINNPTRFRVLPQFANEAVLDRETQLVWQRDLGIEYGHLPLRTSWDGSHMACKDAIIGGRRGWRLPSAEELASLLDPTQTTPALPAGHPFLNVAAGNDDLFWTDSRFVPAFTFVVCFSNACKNLGVQSVFPFPNSELMLRWCVRGGQGPSIIQ